LTTATTALITSEVKASNLFLLLAALILIAGCASSADYVRAFGPEPGP
jgi:uncharacterized lipoprotein YajG